MQKASKKDREHFKKIGKAMEEKRPRMTKEERFTKFDLNDFLVWNAQMAYFVQVFQKKDLSLKPSGAAELIHERGKKLRLLRKL